MSNGYGQGEGGSEVKKLFVGGLSWDTTEDNLREYFGKFGSVAECTLKKDPNTGRSRGFGFISFDEAGSVDNVLAEKNHYLQGKNIDPKKAKARGDLKEPIKKIFVGGVDPSTPEADLRAHFEQFGKVEEVALPFDKAKQKRKGFVFVTFDSEDSVDRACENPRQTINGKECDVKKATPQDQQGGFGGGRGGRGGGRGGRGGGSGGYGGGYGGYGGGYNQGGWGGNSGYGYENGGYDYSGYGQGYNQGYGSSYGSGGYGGDYSSYGSGYSGGYGDQSGYQQQSGKIKGNESGYGYHPYQR